MKSVYLINPKSAVADYYGSEVFTSLGISSTIMIADLATTTVAACIPNEFDVQICDENLQDADLSHDAEVIGITGKNSNTSRIIELATEYRSRGKLILIGGPVASLAPELFRKHCEILVIGEIENIASKLFSDILSNNYQREYRGSKSNLSNSPIPRWDLYPNHRTLCGSVQTSRGCPFICEYCDVIQYVGRKQRHKSVQQVILELETLRGFGYKSVFLADDNFTVYRRRSKLLLEAIAEWNDTQSGAMRLWTQVSIDTARDSGLLGLYREAGFVEVYVGIETPNMESLKEAGKRQNLKISLSDEVAKFLDQGIAVSGGMIVGFDSDNKNIFELQFEFAMESAIPFFTLSALVAPSTTPLFTRLNETGRIDNSKQYISGTPWDTNIVPMQMTRDELKAGLKWLANKLYQPKAFEHRMMMMIDRLGKAPAGLNFDSAKTSMVDIDAAKVVRCISRYGQREATMLRNIFRRLNRSSNARSAALVILLRYAQVRHSYAISGLWERSWEDNIPPVHRLLN